MKKITLLFGMVFLIALAVNASADIRCLQADEQAALNGSGYYCYESYVSNCANACYGGEYRSRGSKAGSCVFTSSPYTCWSTGSVVTCTIAQYTDPNCSGTPYTYTAWTGPSCEDDS